MFARNQPTDSIGRYTLSQASDLCCCLPRFRHPSTPELVGMACDLTRRAQTKRAGEGEVRVAGQSRA